MRKILLLIILACGILSARAGNIAEVHSPGGAVSCYVSNESTRLIGIVNLNSISGKVMKMDLGLSTSLGTLGLSSDNLVSVDSYEYRDYLATDFGEQKSVTDNYNYIVMRMKGSSFSYEIHIRAYDEGLAVRYKLQDGLAVSISSDYTSLDLSSHSPVCYSESGNESGYTKRATSASCTSLAPLFIQCSGFCVLMNEANNPAAADRASLKIKSGVYSFVQSYDAGYGTTTSWRYFIASPTPAKMLKAKYLVYSLNDKATADFSWVKPGKVFRSCCSDNVFYTDTVKLAIDFAKRMNYSYVLLDAGWYGLGYSKEHNAKSDPLQPISTLDVPEVVSYAKSKGIGIFLYVNKVAWENYDNTKMLDLYQSWGVKGLKLGFMDGVTKDGLQKIYSIVKGAADRGMMINIHDNIRQTGLERNLQNLMTVEGIKGNEHRENDGSHTTLLPFSRYMTGSADYTICYRGYPVNTDAYQDMPTTKGHQLALTTAFFCPIQAMMWYGKHYEYPNETEIEYFKRVPTVWDDYEVLEAEPTKYFSIARVKDGVYYIATMTYSARTAKLNLGFLPSDKKYNATIYEDAASSTIKRTYHNGYTSSDEVELSLESNGGAVMILELADGTNDFPTTDDGGTGDNPSDSSTVDNPSTDIHDDEPTPVEEIEPAVIAKDNKFTVYPNPATSTIEFSEEFSSQTMYIYSVGGRLVEKIVLSGRSEIDVTNLHPGIYILTNGRQSAKFVKR